MKNLAVGTAGLIVLIAFSNYASGGGLTSVFSNTINHAVEYGFRLMDAVASKSLG